MEISKPPAADEEEDGERFSFCCSHGFEFQCIGNTIKLATTASSGNKRAYKFTLPLPLSLEIHSHFFFFLSGWWGGVEDVFSLFSLFENCIG